MKLLYLTVLFPLIGFLLLAFSRGHWSKKITTIIGTGSIGLTSLTAFWIAFTFLDTHKNNILIYNQTLWHWITIDHLQIPITLSLDGLSLTMMLIVTGVGFLIHLYASWYMHKEKDYSRFFAYMNLFIANMLILILADNLLFMYLGWEGVGLCSYLLINFYHTKSRNGTAAIKAFLITRIGDILLVFAIFIFYDQLGTLNFHDLMFLAPQKLENSPYITLATLMLLGGAIGKSAQLPLQTWLADAMAGPTPVSALIHAATMVTAGVYLIVRTHSLFLLTPNVLYLISILGSITLLLASLAALVQTDIKRILAYSTMSQIGYMFLSLGIKAWEAAIFHLMTHAFFKALLFLSSGSLILTCNHEQNIFKMGGLRKSIPLVYVCFLVGGAALSAFPFITSGFYSKDTILCYTLLNKHYILMLTGLIGSFLTSIYTFRMIFIIFHGKEKIKISSTYKGINHYLPLLILLTLSTAVGALITPPLAGVIPSNECNLNNKLILEIFSGIISIIGIILAIVFWIKRYKLIKYIATSNLGRFFIEKGLHAWGFDWFYDKIFVKPYLTIAGLISYDPLNKIMNLPVLLIRRIEYILTLSVNGKLRWYAMLMSLGTMIMIIILVFI